MAKTLNTRDIVLGHYEVVDLIISGGQSIVAKGIDKHTNQFVVIKQMLACSGQGHYKQELARFKREAAAIIGHPNVVDAIICGQQDGEWYMVMPFVEGVTLEEYVNACGGKLPVEQAIAVVRQIALGLNAIHQKGYVHRDIKPANIMIGTDGHVSILDKGICRNLNEQTITDGKALLGSILWMSPEQATSPGVEDYRSDLYSLGAIFYYLLTGTSPSNGKDVPSIITNICKTTPPAPTQINPAVSKQIDQICMQLLAKRPEARFQAADEFIQAIDGLSQSGQGNLFCTACCAQVPDGTKYCTRCGMQLDAVQNNIVKCLACGTQTGETSACSGCNRVFSPSDHRFCFTKGTVTGTAFRIPEGSFYTGRDEISSRDCMISRRHLSVICENGKVYIEDAGSANQTYVAGQLADRRTPLLPDCEIYLAGNMAIYKRKI